MEKEHLLVQLGRKRFNTAKEEIISFVDNHDANVLINDLDHYPHAFFLACCMDRQTIVERVWLIPLMIKKVIGSFEMDTLASKSEEDYKKIFADNNLHRFNDKMASVFFRAVQLIQNKYNNDVSKIWEGCPSSASVVYKFMEFYGVGIKIATMAANILARQFRVPFSDFYSIDVSPDIHVKRVMSRIGLVENDADTNMFIYKARELCPEFPGIIDFPLWEIGRTWCISKSPNCDNCMVKQVCKNSSGLLVTN